MSAYVLPTSPIHDQLYPLNPAPGQVQFKYSVDVGGWLVNLDSYHHTPFPLTPQGRLTLTSNTPILPGQTLTSSSTIYYTPYEGSIVTLYNPSVSMWEYHTLSELSTTVSGWTDNVPTDLFLYHNGTSLALEQSQWATYNTRAVDLVRQDGMLVKTGEPNKLYLGAAFATSNIVKVDFEYSGVDNQVKEVGILNAYHRVTGVGRNRRSTNQQIGTTLVGVHSGRLRCLKDPHLSNYCIVSVNLWGASNGVTHLVSVIREYATVGQAVLTDITITADTSRTDHYGSGDLVSPRHNIGVIDIRQLAYVSIPGLTMTASDGNLNYQIEY